MKAFILSVFIFAVALEVKFPESVSAQNPAVPAPSNGVTWQPIAPLIVGFKLVDQSMLWIREDGRIMLGRPTKGGVLDPSTVTETDIQCAARAGFDFTWKQCRVLPAPKCGKPEHSK